MNEDLHERSFDDWKEANDFAWMLRMHGFPAYVGSEPISFLYTRWIVYFKMREELFDAMPEV